MSFKKCLLILGCVWPLGYAEVVGWALTHGWKPDGFTVFNLFVLGIAAFMSLLLCPPFLSAYWDEL